MLVLPGTADLSCPIEWSEATVAAQRQAGETVELEVYPGQPHVFTSAWRKSIEQTTAFLAQHGA